MTNKLTKAALLSDFQKAVLNASSQEQAELIKGLTGDDIFQTAYFFYTKGKKEFLRLLPVSIIAVLLRAVLNSETLNPQQNSDWEALWTNDPGPEGREYLEARAKLFKETLPVKRMAAFLHELTMLAKFSAAWKKVQDDQPTQAYRFLPSSFIQAALSKQLTCLNVMKESVPKIMGVVWNGTEDEFISNIEQISDNLIKRMEALRKRFGSENAVTWIAGLMEALPCEQKVNLFFGTQVSCEELQKIFAVCAFEHYYVNDDRSNPRPLLLSLVDFHSSMNQVMLYEKERTNNKLFSDLVYTACKYAIPTLAKFLSTISDLGRAADVLDFLHDMTVDYNYRPEIVQALDIVVVKELFVKKQCLWMREYLSPEQLLAFKQNATATATTVALALKKRDQVSEQVYNAGQGLSLNTKFNILLQNQGLRVAT